MHLSCHYKRLKVKRLKIAIAAVIISLFFMPYYIKYEKTGDNCFSVSVNGVYVGTTPSVEDAERCLLTARKNLNAKSEELTFIETTLSYEGTEVDWGKIDTDTTVISNIENVLSKAVRNDIQKAFEVKINGYIVDLNNKDEVLKMLQAPISKYDTSGNYVVTIHQDSLRELPVLSPLVGTEEEIEDTIEASVAPMFSAGFDFEMDTLYESIEPDVELELEDYELGITSMDFGDKIEVVEVYVNPEEIDSLDAAIEEVTKEEATNDVYKVKSGDTLSQIAITVGVPMEDLIAMNDSLEDQNSMIRPDDELIYAVPKPKLAVLRQEVMYYEETYDLPVEKELRDDWYTSDVEVLQQPSAGFHKVVATVSFENDKDVGNEILAENVVYQPVAKRIMTGTKIPPTYIKPLYGGRMSSTFGPRKRPTKGASTYHKGIDWATPVGTPIYASCGGTVAKAGWGSGYGNVIYINHPDGRQTRYGHLSKILVSPGQTVSQGQKIALSGNTGVSSGPHVHFEILIGGTQVNPLKYL